MDAVLRDWSVANVEGITCESLTASPDLLPPNVVFDTIESTDGGMSSLNPSCAPPARFLNLDSDPDFAQIFTQEHKSDK